LKGYSLVNLIEFFMIFYQTNKDVFLLERARVPWTPEEGRGPFIGKGPLEDGDERTVVILGGGSERVSF